MRLRLAAAGLILLVLGGMDCRPPARCTASVQAGEPRIVGERLKTSFRIRHSGGVGERAMVFFEYWIRYRRRNGELATERGVYRQAVEGPEQVVEAWDLPLFPVAAISGIEIGEASCSWEVR